MSTLHRLWIDGKWLEGSHIRELHAPFDGQLTAKVVEASPAQMEAALRAAKDSFEILRKLSRYSRSRLLSAMAQGIQERRADFVSRMVHEAGKPRMMADMEVSRAISTFSIASEEVRRFGGEVIPMDLEAASRAFSPAVSSWIPRGPVLAIAPFNFPLNLIAHKVAPALAVGASVIIKPAPQAPGCAHLLAEVFEKAVAAVSDPSEKIPLGCLQVINGPNEVIGLAVRDPRIGILSFTGSDKVGWMLQSQAIRKKICLELGGNAAVIVHSDADLPRASARCSIGGFSYAGQVCISVQRIFVQESVLEKFTGLFLQDVAKVRFGDPAQEGILVGPMIDSGAADRVMSWIEEAKQGGAKVLLGGNRKGNVIEPTVVTGVKPEHKLSCEEVFGPVVVLNSYRDFKDALKAVNDSRYGLQAGVFTENRKTAHEASEGLEVGGVLINEIPTYRADHMPYGGMKDSGLGREGLRYAMEDFCERRLVISWNG